MFVSRRSRAQTFESAVYLFSRSSFIKKGLQDLFLRQMWTHIFKGLLLLFKTKFLQTLATPPSRHLLGHHLHFLRHHLLKRVSPAKLSSECISL
ncbi:hypothetical protein HanRHA438_Chr05g0210681 [Helianthus annuus]|nr:hypothetical protein HanRHA438_Chr05g0210681 [Helianthus annuus]